MAKTKKQFKPEEEDGAGTGKKKNAGRVNRGGGSQDELDWEMSQSKGSIIGNARETPGLEGESAPMGEPIDREELDNLIKTFGGTENGINNALASINRESLQPAAKPEEIAELNANATETEKTANEAINEINATVVEAENESRKAMAEEAPTVPTEQPASAPETTAPNKPTGTAPQPEKNVLPKEELDRIMDDKRNIIEQKLELVNQYLKDLAGKIDQSEYDYYKKIEEDQIKRLEQISSDYASGFYDNKGRLIENELNQSISSVEDLISILNDHIKNLKQLEKPTVEAPAPAEPTPAEPEPEKPLPPDITTEPTDGGHPESQNPEPIVEQPPIKIENELDETQKQLIESKLKEAYDKARPLEIAVREIIDSNPRGNDKLQEKLSELIDYFLNGREYFINRYNSGGFTNKDSLLKDELDDFLTMVDNKTFAIQIMLEEIPAAPKSPASPEQATSPEAAGEQEELDRPMFNIPFAQKNILSIFNEAKLRMAGKDEFEAEASAKFVKTKEINDTIADQKAQIIKLIEGNKEGINSEELIEKIALLIDLDKDEVERVLLLAENFLSDEAAKNVSGRTSKKKMIATAAGKAVGYTALAMTIPVTCGATGALGIIGIRVADRLFFDSRKKKAINAETEKLRTGLESDPAKKEELFEKFMTGLAAAKQREINNIAHGKKGEVFSWSDFLDDNPELVAGYNKDEKDSIIKSLDAIDRIDSLNRKKESSLTKIFTDNRVTGNLLKFADKLLIKGGNNKAEQVVSTVAFSAAAIAAREMPFIRNVLTGIAGWKVGGLIAEGVIKEKEATIVSDEDKAEDILQKLEAAQKESSLVSSQTKKALIKLSGAAIGAVAPEIVNALLGHETHAVNHETTSHTATEAKAGATTEAGHAAAAETKAPEFTASAEQLKIATIGKGEGIEHALHRQLEANAKDLGYNGPDDASAIHHWAGVRAHQIAIAEHYVDPKTGAEIRVGSLGDGHAQYVLDNKGHIHELMDGKPVSSHGPMAAKEFEYIHKGKATADAEVHTASTTETPAARSVEVPATEHISESNINQHLQEIDNKFAGSEGVIRQAAIELNGSVNQEKLAFITGYFNEHPEFKPSPRLIELITSGNHQADKLLSFLENPAVTNNPEVLDLINNSDIFSNQKNMADWLDVFLGATSRDSSGMSASLEHIMKTNGFGNHYKNDLLPNMPELKVSDVKVGFGDVVTFKTPAPINTGLTDGRPVMISWTYRPGASFTTGHAFEATLNFRGRNLSGSTIADSLNPNDTLKGTFNNLVSAIQKTVARKL